jgi:hypothetical protein
MIQATPFDLRLLTAADGVHQDRETHYEQVYTQLTQYRDWLLDTNERLRQNPELSGCGLRIPLTARLFGQLSNTPPWSQAQRGSLVYNLKVQVLTLLANRYSRTADTTMSLDDSKIEHVYELVNVSDFFPPSLEQELCDAWTEVVGVCSFECGIQPFVAPLPLHRVWCVCLDTQEPMIEISRTHILNADASQETRPVPLFAHTNAWEWEFAVRECLWQDRRLPFWGGPENDQTVTSFGYRPPQGWRPGERPSRYGYQDALGGQWEWEGGRAAVTAPLNGHWNVQLDSSSQRHWIHYLERFYEQSIRLHSDHINIEVNGQIVDYTFDRC